MSCTASFVARDHMRGKVRRWVQARASWALESSWQTRALCILSVVARHYFGGSRAKERFVCMPWRLCDSEGVYSLVCAGSPGEPRRRKSVSYRQSLKYHGFLLRRVNWRSREVKCGGMACHLPQTCDLGAWIPKPGCSKGIQGPVARMRRLRNYGRPLYDNPLRIPSSDRIQGDATYM